MGTVLINGKRYDSRTGLMIDGIDTNSKEIVADEPNNATAPSWLNSFVDETAVEASNNEAKAETKATAKTPRSSKADTRDSQDSHDELRGNESDNKAKSVNAAQSQPAGPTAAERLHGPTIRTGRAAKSSQTLSRRFVRKPSSELGTKTYAKPLAIVEDEALAKSHTQTDAANAGAIAVKVASKVTTSAGGQGGINSVDGINRLSVKRPIAKTNAVDTPDKPFNPILTRNQARNIEKHNSDSEQVINTLDELKTTGAKVLDQLLEANQRVSSSFKANQEADDNNRLGELSRMLQNVQALEEDEDEAAANHDNDSASIAKAKASRRQERRARAARVRRQFKAPAIFTTATAMVIVAALGIYFAMPSLSVKIAASRAGVDAKNPYIPAGYTIDGTVAYAPGQVTINYSKPTDPTNKYSIVQRRTTDTAASMREQIAKTTNDGYQEFESNGKTIFTYNGQIAWVKNNVAYTINSNNHLDNNQIIDIADSLSK